MPITGFLILGSVCILLYIIARREDQDREKQRERVRGIQPPRCPCGYNLTGNTSGICPECAREIFGEE